ncbi:Ig-like domain-containing protein, partial [Belliella aquatica]
MNKILLGNFKEDGKHPEVGNDRSEKTMNIHRSNRKDRASFFPFSFSNGSRTVNNKIINYNNMFFKSFMDFSLERMKQSKFSKIMLYSVLYLFVISHTAKGQNFGPGGVKTDLEIWLRADKGTSSQIDGSLITTWQDQSGKRTNIASSSSGTQNYLNNGVSNINFNPVVSFDGLGGFNFGNDYIFTPSEKGGVSIYANVQPAVTPATKTTQFLFDFGNFATTGYGFAFGSQGIHSYTPGITPAFLAGGATGSVPVSFDIVFGTTGNSWARMFGSGGQQRSINLTSLSASNVTAGATHQTTLGPMSIGRQSKDFGFTSNDTRAFQGNISEFFHFNRILSDNEKQRIMSYLNMKYGYTMSYANSATGLSTNKDYLDSDSRILWNATSNSDFHFRITAIGRDDASDFHQRQSRSNNAARLFVMGNNNIIDPFRNSAEVGNDIATDKSFLIIGDNGSAQTQPTWVFNNNLSNNNYILSTVWKAQETGNIGSVKLQFHTSLSGTPNFIPGAIGRKVFLIVSPDNNFTDNNNTLIPLIQEGNEVAVNVDLKDGDFFSLVTFIESPGGVGAGLSHWLKADYAVPVNATNNPLSWLDASPFSRDIAGFINDKLLWVENGINFNPQINFTGGFFRGRLNGDPMNFSGSFTQGDVFGMVKGSSTTTVHGFPWDYGSGARNSLWTWSDANIFDGFGTTDRLGFLPTTATISSFDGKTGVTSIQHAFNSNHWSLYNTFSRAGSWGINRNGNVVAVTATNTANFSGSTLGSLPNVHVGAVAGVIWNGFMPEVILYDRVLALADRQKVNTYLAIKYGITINQNYIAPNGTVLWNRTTNSIYHNRVIGIYRSDIQGLHQRQSKPIDDLINQQFLFIGNNEIINYEGNSSDSGNDLSVDESYLMIGDNNQNIDFNFSFAENKTHFLMARKWKAQTAGLTEKTRIEVPAFGNSNSTALSNLSLINKDIIGEEVPYLAIDPNGDGNWLDATFIQMSLSNQGTNSMWTADINLPDGALFTIALKKVDRDSDGDGILDIDDLDDDNDGISDVEEMDGRRPLFAVESVNTSTQILTAKAHAGPDTFGVTMALTGTGSLNAAAFGGEGLHHAVFNNSTTNQPYTMDYTITPLEGEQTQTLPKINLVEFGLNLPKHFGGLGGGTNDPVLIRMDWNSLDGVYAVVDDPFNQISSHSTGDVIYPGAVLNVTPVITIRNYASWKVTFYTRDTEKPFNFKATVTPNNGATVINNEFFGINIYSTRLLDDDLDGVPNHLDLDSDGDGCFDSFEGGATAVASQSTFTSDLGANGWVSTSASNDRFNATNKFVSTYGKARSFFVKGCLDSDGDGVFDDIDIDDDNDGILDRDEMDCGLAFSSVPQITSGLLGYRQFEGNFYKGQAYADYKINFFNVGSALNNSTWIDIAQGGLHYQIETSAIYYTSNFVITPSEPSILNAFRFGPQVPSNAIAAAASVGIQTLTLDWNPSFTARVHDPNNQLEQLDGAILTPGMSIKTRTNLSVANSTWRIIFEGGGTEQEFDLRVNHFFNTALTAPFKQGWGIAADLCFVEDFDNDGIPNHLDTDSDGDGCPDAFEANATSDKSLLFFQGPVGNNGLMNSLQTNDTQNAEVNYPQTNYLAYSQVSACADSDGDGIPDRDDIDDDNDGILDIDEYLCGESMYINSYSIPTGVAMGAGGSFSNGDFRARGNFQFGSLNTLTNFSSERNSASYLVNDANTNYNLRATVSPNSSSISEFRFGPSLNGNLNSAVSNAQQSIVVNWSIPIGGIVIDPENQLSSHVDGQGIVSGGTIVTRDAYTVAQSKWYIVIPINYLTRDFVFNASFTGVTNFGEESFGIAVNLCSRQTDSDGDGLPNAIDTDSDGDGCFDAVESKSLKYSSLTSATLAGPYGVNGLSALVKTDDTPLAKTNYDLSMDFLNSRLAGCIDTDNDGIPDQIDIDDDNDGILDEVECPSAPVISSYTWVPDEISTRKATYKLIANTGQFIGTVAITAVQNLDLAKFGLTAAPNEFITVNPKDNSVNGGFIEFVRNNTSDIILEFSIQPAPGIAALDLDVLGTEGGNGGYWFNSRSLKIDAGAAGDGTIVGIPQPYYMKEKYKVGQTLSSNMPITTSFRTGLSPSTNKQFINVQYSQIATVDKPFVMRYTYRSLMMHGIWGENYAFQILRLGILANENGPCDHDGDGIPNSLDPDSDNDGCNDGVEAGVIPVGTTVPLQGEVGANGFMDYLETAPESGIYKGNYSYLYALNDQIDGCEDFDGDGIPDLIDIDDDNDGILDHIESPSCFLTPADWNGTDKRSMLQVSSDLTTLDPNINFANLLDNNQVDDAIQFMTSSAQAQLSKTIFLFDFSRPVQLDAIYIKKASATNIFANVTGSVMVQGSNDFATWTDLLTSAVNPTNATNFTANGSVILTNSNKLTLNTNPDAYKFYRIVGAAAGNIQSGIATELYFDVNTNVYNPSNYPKIGQCMVDTDGDGQPNHLDLDSDGDGCPDAVEAKTVNNLTDTIVPGPYGPNGFGDGVETVAESGIYKGDYTYYFAVNKNVTRCLDTDGDGVPDIEDLDSDNDGVLDSVESPGCDNFLTLFKEDFGIVGVNPDMTGFAGTQYTEILRLGEGDGPALGVDVVPGYPWAWSDGDRFVQDGQYAIVSNAKLGGYNWLNASDYSTKDSLEKNGGMLLINGSNPGQVAFRKPASNLVPGKSYKFSAWIADIFPGGTIRPDLQFQVKNSSGAITSSVRTGPIVNGSTTELNWKQYELIFVATTTTMTLELVSFGNPGNGNDFVIDDVELKICLGNFVDTDGDGIPNYLDLDSDGDGCPDAVEAGTAKLAQSLGYSVSSDGVVAGPYGDNGFADYLETSPESGSYRDTYTYNFAITVGKGSTITSQPEDVKVFGDGQTATFTAVVDDSEASSTPIYQWQISTNGGATWSNVTNSSTYEGASTKELKVIGINGDMNGYRFRLSVSQLDFVCDNYFSDAVKLSVDGLPEAIDDIVTTPQGENAEGNILTNDSKREGSEGTLSVKTFEILDSNGDPLPGPFVLGEAYVIPNVGTLTLNANGTFEFDPLVGFSGKVPTVIYQMEDSEGGTDIGTLSITVTKLNQPPVANDQNLNVNEDTALTGNLLSNGGATDPDGDPVKITDFTLDGVTYNAGTTVDIPGVGVIKINENGSFEFTPALNYNGPVPPVTYTVVDVNGGKDTATLNITVDPVNDAPLAADDIVGTTEGTNAIGNVLTNDTDVDGDLLTVTQFVVDGKTVTIDPSTGGTESLEGIGTITINADGSFTFVPDPEFRQGQVPTITYTISDGSATTTAKLDIFVEPVPEAPIAADDTATLTEDSILTCTTGNCNLLDNDAVDPLFPNLQLKITQINFTVEGKEYTYPVGVDAVIPGVGIVKVNEDGTYEFKPDANWNGTVPAITYTITDGEGNTANADLNITVTPVNDAPIAVDDNVTTRRDEPVSGNVLTNDSDVDNNKEDLTVIQFEVNGVIYPVSASTPGTVTITGVGTLTVESDGTFTFTPEAGYTGPVPPVTYTVSDGEDTSSANLNIVVSEFNQLPVANNDVATTDDQTPAQGNVLSNDKDDDVNDVLEVVSFTLNGITYSAGRIVEIPEVGEFTLQADGTYTFVPVPGFNGDIPTVTYTVTDGFGGVDSASLNIKVTIKDSDGDGVPDFQEILDGTDPNNPCSFDPANQVEPSAEWLAADCDGDGINNGDELAAGTNLLDPCDFSMEDFDISKTSAAWKALDCDGDGVTNGEEIAAGTSPIDPCDFSMDDFDMNKTSAAWKALDCDGDGVLNGEDSCPFIFADNGLGCPLPVDFNVTDINVPVTGDVSTNDEVPAGTTYGTPQPQTDNPAGATLTMNADGTYAFTATEPGVYTYMVPVCGPGETEDCPLSPLQITVLDPMADDNAPVVNPDIATAKEDTPVKIDVLSNDESGNVGTDLNPASLTITEEPDNGTVTINSDGTVTYTPDAGFTGTDVFTYTVCDTSDPANCQTGTVTVTVVPED